MTTRGEQPDNGEGISEEGERWITLAIAIAFVALIPSAVLGFLLWQEIDTRSEANTELIEEDRRHEEAQERLRVAARNAIRRADIANCREDELVKARLRELVAFDEAGFLMTLEVLGIDPSSERAQRLEARSRARALEAQVALRKRDCSKLPDPTEVFDETP